MSRCDLDQTWDCGHIGFGYETVDCGVMFPNIYVCEPKNPIHPHTHYFSVKSNLFVGRRKIQACQMLPSSHILSILLNWGDYSRTIILLYYKDLKDDNGMETDTIRVAKSTCRRRMLGGRLAWHLHHGGVDIDLDLFDNVFYGRWWWRTKSGFQVFSLIKRTLNYNMFTFARIGIDLDVGWSQTLIFNPLVQLDFDGIDMIWLLPCGLWVNVLNILSTSAKEIVCFSLLISWAHLLTSSTTEFENWLR